MTDLPRLIEKLGSPKSSTRYEACEELRLAEFSSGAAIDALEKATTSDPDPLVADAAARALEAEVHSRMLAGMGRLSPKAKEKQERLDRESRLAGMLLVTTPWIEGRHVDRYLGIVSAEAVIGTGILSELTAGITDLTGTRSEAFEAKLTQAKDAALKELALRAADLGADAVIGMDLDYSTLRNDMMIVVANGTAVRLDRVKEGQ